ncbi:MAG: cysteine peptidase family C39 domain-containing protein [Planctomycetota bacterium]
MRGAERGARRCLGLALLCALGGCASSADLRAALRERGGPLVEPVPFVPQEGTIDCGASAAAALLGHAGQRVDAEELRRRLVRADRGTYTFELSLLLWRRGLYPWARWDQPQQEVERWLRAGRPVALLVAVWPWKMRWRHFVVVCGIDSLTGTALVHTGSEPYACVPLEDLLEAWRRAGRWALVAVPPDGPSPPQLSASELARLGLLAERAGLRTRAVQHYTAALAADPTLTRARANRGAVRVELGDLELAVLDLRAAATQAPDDPSILNDLAWALERRAGQLERPAAAALLLEAHGLARRALSLAGPELRGTCAETLTGVERAWRARLAPLALPSPGES